MTKGLTTHVLDLTNGIPAANLMVELWKFYGTEEDKQLLTKASTNKHGRIDSPLLYMVVTGQYEIIFYVGDYYRKLGMTFDEPMFFNKIPVRFGLHSKQEHYHIPLLISPWGYQTYRGS
jgi:5-hydroxyisourate hydrolase